MLFQNSLVQLYPSKFTVFPQREKSINSVIENFTIIVPDVYGCTNPTAYNFNVYATKNDGSCKLP